MLGLMSKSSHLIGLHSAIQSEGTSLPSGPCYKLADICSYSVSGVASIKDLVTRLENGFSTLSIMCDMDLVLVFTLLTRALGHDTRNSIATNTF